MEEGNQQYNKLKHVIDEISLLIYSSYSKTDNCFPIQVYKDIAKSINDEILPYSDEILVQGFFSAHSSIFKEFSAILNWKNAPVLQSSWGEKKAQQDNLSNGGDDDNDDFLAIFQAMSAVLRTCLNVCAGNRENQDACMRAELHRCIVPLVVCGMRRFGVDGQASAARWARDAGIGEQVSELGVFLDEKLDFLQVFTDLFFLRCVQFLCNMVAKNAHNAGVLWNSCYPLLFESLFETQWEAILGPALALFHNCMIGDFRRRAGMVLFDQTKEPTLNLLGVAVSCLESSTEGVFEWASVFMERFIIEGYLMRIFMLLFPSSRQMPFVSDHENVRDVDMFARADFSANQVLLLKFAEDLTDYYVGGKVCGRARDFAQLSNIQLWTDLLSLTKTEMRGVCDKSNTNIFSLYRSCLNCLANIKLMSYREEISIDIYNELVVTEYAVNILGFQFSVLGETGCEDNFRGLDASDDAQIVGVQTSALRFLAFALSEPQSKMGVGVDYESVNDGDNDDDDSGGGGGGGDDDAPRIIRNNHVWKVQKHLREIGGIPIILSHLRVDRMNPLMREWGVLVIRNLCASNEENQTEIASYELRSARSDDELKRAGFEAYLDPVTKQPRLKKITE